jgi:hypothetical protein
MSRNVGPQKDETNLNLPSEEEILRKLKSYLCMKMATTQDLWIKYKLYRESKAFATERKYIKEILFNESVIPEACFFGVCVTLSSFVLLSRLPRLGMTIGQRSSQTQSSGNKYTLDIPPGEEKSFKFFSTATNVLLFFPMSVMMGGVTIRELVSNYSDHEDMAEKISKIPLLPGRSMVSDELCSSLIDAGHKIQNCQLKPLRSKELRHYMTFAHNCRSRELYEQIVREDLHVSPSHTVVVTSTGVPILEEREFGSWSDQAVLDQQEAPKHSPPR